MRDHPPFPASPSVARRHLCPGMVQNHAEGTVWGAVAGSFVAAAIPAAFLGSYPAAAIFGIGVVISGFQAVGTFRQALDWRQGRERLLRAHTRLQDEYRLLQEEFASLQEEAGAMIRRRNGKIRFLADKCTAWEQAAVANLDFQDFGSGPGTAPKGKVSRQPLGAGEGNVVEFPGRGMS